MERIDKQALVAGLRAAIAGDLETATRSARDAAEAATHEENRPENDKDMRSTEASYLARGQAERVRELERSDDALRSLELRPFGPGDAIAAGSLVIVEHGGSSTAYLLAPAGGGIRTTAGGIVVQVVTPRSPLGQALLGRSAGDVTQVAGPGGVREIEIVDVQ